MSNSHASLWRRARFFGVDVATGAELTVSRRPEQHSPMSSRENMRGLVAMLVAVGSLALMDGALKTLSPHYAALEIAAIRGWSALPATLAMVLLSGGFAQLRSTRLGLQ